MSFYPKACARLALLFAVSWLEVHAEPPTIDPFEPPTNYVVPNIPVGKSLVVPISVTNPDGAALTFKVTSSNPKIQARIKTGNPILRLHVVYEGEPAFEGDLDLQLFRDLAPVTTGFISGFAQSGYYDNQIFHRIIEDFVIQGGDPAGTGTGGPGFNFEHEFQPSLIFSGVGQLAMANSAGGYNRGATTDQFPAQIEAGEIGLGDFTATNGSQFFITTSTQHHNLDFKHTIFGQLVRGWPLLAQLNSVPVDASDKPTSNVRLQSAKILPGNSEATILLGARGAGSSTITVTVQDAVGNVTSRSFTANAVADTINNRPFLLPLPTEFARVDQTPPIYARGIDLEQDRMSFGIAGVRETLSSTTGDFYPNSIGFATVLRNYGTTGVAGVSTFAVGVSSYLEDSAGYTPYDDPGSREGEFIPFYTYKWEVQRFVLGKKVVKTETVVLEPTAATAGTFVTARFGDTDPGNQPDTYAATINWGDGSAEAAGTVTRDGKRPGAGLYSVNGAHTYARPGIYTATTFLRWNAPNLVSGETPPEIARIRSTVYVSAAGAPIHAQGTAVIVKNKTGALSNRILATFTDTTKTRRPADYLATIDWGDGVQAAARVVKTAPGKFAVRGTHTFRDPELFPLSVRIHPVAAADDTGDAIAWSTAAISGFPDTQHAPPFLLTNLRTTWHSYPNGPEPAVNKTITGGVVSPYVPGNLTVQLNGQLEIGNSGSKTSAASSIRAWLSDDTTLTPSGAGADTRLKINGSDLIPVGALGPGVLVNTGNTPWVVNLPKGESGGRKYFITEVVYSDPIIDQNNVPKITIIQLPARILGFDRSANDYTTQDGVTKVTFRVVLDTAPTSNVTIPVASSLTTQGTVSPASLVFTPENYNQPQFVTVTGVQDNNADTKSYTVTVGPATSSDTLYNGLTGFSLTLTNRP